MNKEIVTNDLSEFGYIELMEASKLLKVYASDGCNNLNDGLTLNFNKNSGCVFLSDDDFNVFMMNGDKIEQWFNCSYCGHEGFKEDMNHEPKHNECKEYLKQIEVKQ